jgi:hypothetical protein
MQSGLEPAIVCILLAELTPTLRGYIPQRWIDRNAVVTVYTHCYCNTPSSSRCQCTWCLIMITNRLRGSGSAAAPDHNIPRTGLDSKLPKAEMYIRARTGGCYVPADGSPIKNEAVT